MTGDGGVLRLVEDCVEPRCLDRPRWVITMLSILRGDHCEEIRGQPYLSRCHSGLLGASNCDVLCRKMNQGFASRIRTTFDWSCASFASV